MKKDFVPVTFPTVASPNFDLKKVKREINLTGASAALVFFLSLGVSNFSYIFSFIGFFIFIVLIVRTIDRTHDTIFNFINNGHLTIEHSGFKVNQETEYEILFENVKKIIYEYDRPEKGHSRNPPAKTYKLTILLKDNKQIVLFPERQAIKENRLFYGDFPNTMKILRTTNYNLYKIIRNADN